MPDSFAARFAFSPFPASASDNSASGTCTLATRPKSGSSTTSILLTLTPGNWRRMTSNDDSDSAIFLVLKKLPACSTENSTIRRMPQPSLAAIGGHRDGRPRMQCAKKCHRAARHLTRRPCRVIPGAGADESAPALSIKASPGSTHSRQLTQKLPAASSIASTQEGG